MNKSGQQIAKDNVAKLSHYLELNKEHLPAFADGTLNKSAIARAAGLDRQIFTTNPEAQRVLKLYGLPSNRPHVVSNLEENELRRKKDAEISRLRALLSSRELELSKLRQEVQILRQYKAINETMVDTMRHVKPPPKA